MTTQIKTLINSKGETFLSKPDLIKALVAVKQNASAEVEEFITSLIEALATMSNVDPS